MAALFKTGQELRDERSQELAASTRKALPSSNVAQSIGQTLGVALGQKLAGAFSDDTGVAAGDVDLSDFDLTTASGQQAAGKVLIQQGFPEEGMTLFKKAQDTLNLEQDFASELEGDEDLGKVRVPTERDNQVLLNSIVGQGGLVGESVGQIMAGDDVVEKARISSLLNAINSAVFTLDRDLRNEGKSIPVDALQREFANNLEASGIITDESWFGNFGGITGRDGAVDIKKLSGFINPMIVSVRGHFIKPSGELRTEGVQQVEPTPAQQTTGEEPGRVTPEQAAERIDTVPEAPFTTEQIALQKKIAEFEDKGTKESFIAKKTLEARLDRSREESQKPLLEAQRLAKLEEDIKNPRLTVRNKFFMQAQIDKLRKGR